MAPWRATPLARRRVLYDLRYHLLETCCLVRTDVPDLARALDELYACFRGRWHSRDGSGFAFLQALSRPDGSVVVAGDGLPAERVETLGELEVVVLRRLWQPVLAHLRHHDLIHAGVVAWRNQAVLLPARSTHGKTSLVLGLVRRGFAFLSDEFAVVELETGVVKPFQRGFGVREGTLELVPELGFLRGRRPFGDSSEPRTWFLSIRDLLATWPGALGEAAPVGWVFFLDASDRTAGPRLERMSPGVAALELVRASWLGSQDVPRALESATRVARRARCYRLVAGELEATLDAVVDEISGEEDG